MILWPYCEVHTDADGEKPCPHFVAWRYRPVDPAKEGWNPDHWGHRCDVHIKWLTPNIKWVIESIWAPSLSAQIELLSREIPTKP